MADKRTTKESPEQSGPESVAVVHPAVMEAAVPGNRRGVGDAYGQLAAWLRAGKAPPPELALWGAERLEALARVLHDKRDKHPEKSIPRALGITRSGKRGNLPADDRDRALAAHLVYDVHYALRLGRARTQIEAFEYVATFANNAGLLTVSPATVEAAWKKRKELAPDLFPAMNP